MENRSSPARASGTADDATAATLYELRAPGGEGDAADDAATAGGDAATAGDDATATGDDAAAADADADAARSRFAVRVSGLGPRVDLGAVQKHFRSCGAQLAFRTGRPRECVVQLPDENALGRALRLDGSSFAGATMTVRRVAGGDAGEP